MGESVPVNSPSGGQSRMPPVLNIVALATFAASLSARALDPVLPHVASDFAVSIATAAGFASVFAFTFAIVQPVLGAAADLFGKARLVIVCLVLLGLANILGALSGSGWVSMNTPATPTATAARANTGTNSRSPPDEVPLPPGCCTEWVASNTTGQPVSAMIGSDRMSLTSVL